MKLSALLVLVLVVVAGCGSPAGSAPDTTKGVVPLTEITAAARPAAVSVRADPPTITVAVAPPPVPPPFDPVAYCNSLPYAYQDMGPAMECFRVAALHDGWTLEAIEASWAFAYDVFWGESGGCPITRRGDTYHPGTCDHSGYGQHEDVGIAQATYAVYGPQGVSCKLEGYCQSGQILASPWDSMRASFIVPFRELGRFPWCWDAGARAYHKACSTLHPDWRPL